MTFKSLRKLLNKCENKMAFIEWKNSGIVEAAQLTPNGAIKIINIISQKEYCIPRGYNDINVKVVTDGLISIGKLVPKELR